MRNPNLAVKTYPRIFSIKLLFFIEPSPNRANFTYFFFNCFGYGTRNSHLKHLLRTLSEKLPFSLKHLEDLVTIILVFFRVRNPTLTLDSNLSVNTPRGATMLQIDYPFLLVRGLKKEKMLDEEILLFFSNWKLHLIQVMNE